MGQTLTGKPSYVSEIEKLEMNLRQIDLKNLDISDYSKRYFGDYLRKLNYSIKSCVFIVESSLKNTSKNSSEISFIDYGGGIGLLSIIAKLMGIGNVIYSDIYELATHDARILAQALGIPIEHYVAGDVEELLEYVQKNKIKIDIVASRNVIEHIFDPELFINKISSIAKGPLQLYFATTANPDNPLVNLYTRRIHKKLEYKGMGKAWGNKERDQILAYLDIRKKILVENFPELKTVEIEILAKRCRGYMKENIIRAGGAYILTKNYPAEINDPTNTCDPLTGNWAEHLVPLSEYEKMFQHSGFLFKLEFGFYNTNYPQKILNFITPVLNFFIRHVKFSGKYLAPFICLSAYRK